MSWEEPLQQPLPLDAVIDGSRLMDQCMEAIIGRSPDAGALCRIYAGINAHEPIQRQPDNESSIDTGRSQINNVRAPTARHGRSAHSHAALRGGVPLQTFRSMESGSPKPSLDSPKSSLHSRRVRGFAAPSSMHSFVLSMRRRIMGCCGGFSAYVRASSRGASPGPVASTGRAALLPLPLPEGVSETESVGRRAGVASKHRRAAHELASLTIDWLNFESAGRCPIPIPGNVVTGETTPEQRAASARILHQASAMLRACSGKRLRELGLGRGKVAAACESRDELETDRKSVV